MEYFIDNHKPPEEHVASIFKEYTTPTRVLRSFTNLTNTVIQTALSGQSKFIFEILQNADDAFNDHHDEIAVKFNLQDNYFIVHHNGKGFDFNDVERICDYASQIEEVKATDLRKTGYKGLGFKSLFNLSDCIHIYSNGYSFRFDKTYWPLPENVPWQIIPIWCKYNELPLNEKYPYDQPVNFILKVNNLSQLESQFKELVDQPELLLYLHRINKLSINLNEKEIFLEKRVDKFGVFKKINFYKNDDLESTWLTRTYKRSVHTDVQKFIQGASRFIYPDKIKKAKEVSFIFALRSNEALQEILKIKGLCYSTLPTQLHLMLPYHTNSLFILNLDRTQLHENEWNEFLLYQLGSLQFNLLKDLAKVDTLKNNVIEFFVRKIDHFYYNFEKAFLKGFMEGKFKISWLPPHQGLELLKLGEAWTDETEFFKHNFQNVRNHKIYPYLINYDVKYQNYLSTSEAEVKRFTYDQLFREFPNKYYPQLTRSAYIDFVGYLYDRLKGPPFHTKATNKLKNVPFLRAKDGSLLSPKNALLEESGNPIPDFLMLNPIDNDYLPASKIDSIMEWLSQLGAKRLTTPIQVLRESVLQWIYSGNFDVKITMKNHVGIMNYLFKGYEQLTRKETEKLRERLFILTESKEFKLANLCYLPDAISIKELSNVITDDEKVSSCYDVNNLRGFFMHVGVHDNIKPIDVLRKSILVWIKNGTVRDKLTIRNYKPITDFVALHYPTLEHNLTESEKSDLKKMPVLTCGQVFQKAQVCYFDYVVPKIKGLEHAVANDKLVSTKNISDELYYFLVKIGVSENIAPVDVIRRTVLRWIQDGDIKSRITHNNHQDILKYIGEHWYTLSTSGLKPKEKNDLKRFPVLTKSDVFRTAYTCYWQHSNFGGSFSEEIPGLKSVIAGDEFVSLDYNLKVVRNLLGDIGVRNLTFTDISEKYCDHLTHRENVKWFFSQLVNYWNRNKADKNQLLTCLQQKLRASSCLLAKNGKMYSSTELYSSWFDSMYDIDPNSILLLQYSKLPADLEKFLNFKTELDFKCIKQLLKAIDKKTELGKEKTQTFFKILLEQLRRKDKNEIRRNQLSLLSKDNKLKLAKDLYYFIEEDAICFLDSCYLKRISGMTHKETLELAELCEVNTLPFNKEVKQENEKHDNTLQKFYLERLSLIVVKESKMLNEDVNVTLKRLYDTICTINLYQCQNIYIKYPFGDSTKVPQHFEDLTLYVVGKWVNKKSMIHDYLQEKLDLAVDIRDIIDMELPISESDKQEWLFYQKLDLHKLNFVEEQFKKLLLSEEKKTLNEVTPSERVIIPKIHHSKHEEKNCEDDEMIVRKRKEITSSDLEISSHSETSSDSETFSDENLADYLSDETYLKKPCEIKQDIKFTSSDMKAKLDVLTPVKSENITQPYHSEDDKILLKKYDKFIAESSSSDKSAVNHILDESYLQKLHSIEDEFTKLQFDEERKEFDILTSVESIKLTEPPLSIYEEKNCKMLSRQKEKIATAEYSSSDESSVDHVWCEPYIQKRLAVEGEKRAICDTSIDEPKAMAHTKIALQSIISENIIKTDTRMNNKKSILSENLLNYSSPDYQCTSASIFAQDINSEKGHIPVELKIDSKKSIEPEITSSFSSLENPCNGTFQDTNSEKSYTKWLSEKFVFTFLQLYYQNKYPDSQSNLSNGIFTLQFQSRKIEIVWVNANREKFKSYDLLLIKEGDVKWFIEVKSPVAEESVNISHFQFTTNDQIAAELSKHRGKYCVYHIFCKNISSKLSFEEMKNSAALYKVVPLKIV